MKGILWLAAKNHNLPGETIFNQAAKHFHVTLQFGVERTEFEDLIGKEVEVTIKARCFNDRIEALSVDLPGDIRPLCKNEHPHITISMEEGVKPVESNAMLKGDYNWAPLSYTLQTVVEFFAFNDHGH
jgi:hypothetical protein